LRNFFCHGVIEPSTRIDYDFTRPLQSGFAKQLGFNSWEYVRPKVDSFRKERPIKNKYVTISVHSTAQLKYWNHPSGKRSQPDSPYWDELCNMIRKSGYTPVIVEKDEMFGIPPFRNGLPRRSNNKFGISLEDTINYIEHSEFFIGLSSGLSWLAHALNKPVAMISNFSEDWHEIDLLISDYKRITNKSVCHGCWNSVNKEFKFEFDDWYWCPKHKGTERQFECHTSITPEMILENIKHWL
jgi:autotransporter strand-loop-strand O-heptosyltransferase